MTKRVAVAAAKSISADEAAGFVESGMWLDYGTALCQPDVFDLALASRISRRLSIART
jgi:acyl-CoA hydrolase